MVQEHKLVTLPSSTKQKRAQGLAFFSVVWLSLDGLAASRLA